MDIEIKQKQYLLPKKYWAWTVGGAIMLAVLAWLALSNYSSTLKVERRGLSISEVKQAKFDDYVNVDGRVVPIQVVQISPEEGGVVLEKVVDEGAHVHKGDIIVKLSNSNLDLEILQMPLRVLPHPYSPRLHRSPQNILLLHPENLLRPPYSLPEKPLPLPLSLPPARQKAAIVFSET